MLPELAGLLLGEESVRGLLDVIVNLAPSAVGGVDGASVSLVVREGRQLETANASSELIRAVDEAQYQGREGPCVEAIRTGAEVKISFPGDRWPVFAERARGAGVRSVHSLPLHVRDRTTGALNLYSMSVDALEDGAVEAARALAAQASVVLANASALMSAELANQHLQEALASRDLIGQAKGILMAGQRISADQAFDVLRRRSQASGLKLRDIAAEVVGTLSAPSPGQ